MFCYSEKEAFPVLVIHNVRIRPLVEKETKGIVLSPDQGCFWLLRSSVAKTQRFRGRLRPCQVPDWWMFRAFLNPWSWSHHQVLGHMIYHWISQYIDTYIIILSYIYIYAHIISIMYIYIYAYWLEVALRCVHFSKPHIVSILTIIFSKRFLSLRYIPLRSAVSWSHGIRAGMYNSFSQQPSDRLVPGGMELRLMFLLIRKLGHKKGPPKSIDIHDYQFII